MGEVNEIHLLQHFIYYSLWLLLLFHFITVHGRKYDVFISYRGKDVIVRNNFLTHLRCALKKSGFRVFVDESDIQRGCNIATELPKAIQHSRVALVLLSKSYADSRWCLDELVNIFDCRERLGQIVLPIFFHVSPSTVCKQGRRFGDAFARHQEAPLEEMEKWKNALYHITNLAGFNLRDVNGNESELIEKIIEDLQKKLSVKTLLIHCLQTLRRIMLRIADMVFGYFVRFGYHSAYALKGNPNAPSTSITDFQERRIWCLDVPEKVKIMVWSAYRGILQSNDQNLSCKRVEVDGSCPVCGQEGESVIHCLKDCQLARAVWFGCPLQIRASELPANRFDEFFDIMANRLCKERLGLFCMLCSHLWLNRNNALCNAKNLLPQQIIDNAVLHRVARALAEDMYWMEEVPAAIGEWRTARCNQVDQSMAECT